MATRDFSILGPNTAPDASGSTFFSPLEVEMGLTTAAFGTTLGLQMLAPAAGGDHGVYGSFTIPEGYVDTPVIVVRGILDGLPSGVTMAFSMAYTLGKADSEGVDVAYEEDLFENSTWTGYADEEIIEFSASLTPSAAWVAGDEVFFYLTRDDANDDTTTNFILTSLRFKFNDA